VFMRTKKSRTLLLFGFCSIAVAAMAQRYTITDLGPLGPTGINSWAQVVGNYNGRAFFWTKWDGMRNLGTLAGGTFSRAAAINDVGVVTGTADGLGTVVSPDPDFPNQDCSDLTQPFVWTQRKGLRGLGTLGNIHLPDINSIWCAVAFVGTDINTASRVVGYVPINFELFAFGFSSRGAIVHWMGPDGITVFGGSDPPTFVNGVDDKGRIVGQNSDASTLFRGHATLWKSGVPIDLGTLGGGPDVTSFSSSANGINDRGHIVGWSTTDSIPPSSYGWTGTCPIHAVLWPAGGGIRDLGTLPGDTFSAAWKINRFGLVVGSSGNTVGLPTADDPRYRIIGRPFIWSERTGMRDLNKVISPSSG